MNNRLKKIRSNKFSGRKKTINDYIFYVGTRKQVSDYELLAEFIINYYFCPKIFLAEAKFICPKIFLAHKKAIFVKKLMDDKDMYSTKNMIKKE